MNVLDKTETINALKYFFQEGDVFEIRILDAVTPNYRNPHTVSGYYDFQHIEKAAADIIKEVRIYRGAYFTANPVNPALLARAANRLRDCTSRADVTTNDKDIPRRRWLLIDCDAERPSGVSSNDEEHAAAAAKAQEIKDGLASMGFPEPVVTDSGNGAQLMFRIDEPGEDNGLVEMILKNLQPCNSPAVKIDQTVFNPARIWRLPGSRNCKGDDIPERPHRTAKITSRPEQITPVPTNLLRKAAGFSDIPEESEIPVDNQTSVSDPAAANPNAGNIDLPDPVTEQPEEFNLETFLRRYCPDIEGPQTWRDGRKWIFPVCPFNPEHRNRSAIITQQASGAIGFKCHHDGCKGNDWQKLRELLEPDFLQKKQDRERREQEKAKAAAEAARITKQQPAAASFPDDSDEIDDIPEEPAPWRKIKNSDIRQILDGTFLGEMADLYGSVTIPQLPLEGALIKAIVTAGCALSGEGVPDATKNDFPAIGAQAARLRIDTASGQVCNVYALLAANSASGKDIGQLLDLVTTSHGWNIGQSGSAEGISEALKKTPNGLISISEFMNWIDENHWQHKATSFLTEAFSKGFFRYNFSSRSGKGGLSECDYCYPNIIANVQPEIFAEYVRKSDIASGFMGRFLYCKMPEFFGDPARINTSRIMQRFHEILQTFQRKHGIVEVPQGYGHNLSTMFRQYSPDKLHPVWRRLVNEYLPRFAVMLSINNSGESQGDYVFLKDRHWTDAEKMTQWFFTHAENMLTQIEDESAFSREQEKIMRRLASIIAKYDRGDGVSSKIISRNANHTGTTSESRRKILLEMIDRGWITSNDPACLPGTKYKIKRLPPGILDEKGGLK